MNQIQCPECGKSNRIGARFCQHCRAPLPMAMTTKLCPNCHTQNRLNAKFCSTCGHVFAHQPLISSVRHWIASRASIPLVTTIGSGLVVCLLCALLVIVVPRIFPTHTTFPSSAQITPVTNTPTLTLLPSPTPTTTNAPAVSLTPTRTASNTSTAVTGLERAQRATVLIIVPVDSRPGSYSSGSGTIITKRGHILTNYHIFVDDSGKPENARGEIYIAIPPPTNLKDSAQIRYRARMVQADTKNDLALIQISATSDNQALPPDLVWVTAPIGDSDALALGDAVLVLGYPGVGGRSLTLTRGVISGWDEGLIKTDAEINQGNSGGGAYNATYQLIGVPSMTVLARQMTGKLGLIRPIKAAQPLLELARREAGE